MEGVFLKNFSTLRNVLITCRQNFQKKFFLPTQLVKYFSSESFFKGSRQEGTRHVLSFH